MTLEELCEAINKLQTPDLGYVRRYVIDLYASRVRFIPGLNEEEQTLLKRSKLDAIKAVRNRTGLGLADAKELVERWQRENP